jgi:dihydrofolate reductase
MKDGLIPGLLRATSENTFSSGRSAATPARHLVSQVIDKVTFRRREGHDDEEADRVGPRRPRRADIGGDVAGFVAGLKREPGGTIVKYGNGPLDQVLMENSLIDEFHLLLTPVAAGSGEHMFEAVSGAPQLRLADVRRFASGVLVLVYTPEAGAA